ncbi:MAG: hypothetical protein ACTSP0_05670 [Alphaproteobacteria bacterium]
MTKKTYTLAALGGALLVAFTAAVPADAKIRCQGRNQWNSAAGGWISTPYCEDNLIAAVARSHGMRVSNRAVRQNPSIKEEACRFAGSDIRINDLCAGNMYEDDRRRY